MGEVTMTTAPSPTSTSPKPKRQEQIKDKSNTTTMTDDNSNNAVQIISSHPRFSTSEIIQNFPNIQHRFCHKIKVSIPWKDETTSPNYDTYYKAISYFFDIVKNADPQFQILTWNIHNKESNSISDRQSIPHSHKDLSEYLYNLHITPSRIRTSMVITSAFNLGQPIRNQVQTNDDQLNLLKLFRKEKMWVQPSNIQTMGEIKLVGFLQFIHPHCTNLKKLLIALQAIVETRDIVVELYRPRAINKDNGIIMAPEAIAIGAPSDISIDIYKSLIDKWTGVLKGHYDILIGKESPLKDGYFIPFASGLLSQEDKNNAIIRHGNFVKEYTGFQLKRCTSVDVRFDLSQEETDELGYKIKKDKKKRTTTLRRILESWSDESTDDRLIQSIDLCTATSQTLLIKNKNKSVVNKKITELLEVLKTRTDFATICGNKDNYGASIDRFSFSKSGHSYLTQLKKLRQTHIEVTNNDDMHANTGNKKRERPQVDINPNSNAPVQSISPVHKKSTTTTPEILNENNSTTPNNPTPNNNTTKTTVDPYKKTSVSKPSAKLSFQQIVTNSLPSSSAKIVSYPLTSLRKSTSTAISSDKDTSNNNISTNELQGTIVRAPSNKVVAFIDTPNTSMTPSTMTPEMVPHSQLHNDNNILMRLSEQQILNITNTVTERYEMVIQNLQETYNNQIQQIVKTQVSQKTEIANIKTNQIEMKQDLEQKLDSKINSQTNILHSIVSMMKDIKTTSQDRSEKSNRIQPQSHQNDNKCMSDLKTQSLHVEQDQDLSYSDTDSNPADGDDTYTALTVPSTINTVESQDSKATHIVDTRLSQSKLFYTGNEILSRQSDNIEKCKHINKIGPPEINDIRKVTRTQPIPPEKITKEEGWNDVTTKSKNTTPIKLAIISPHKAAKPKKPNKDSPNYNRYVMTESSPLQKKKNSIMHDMEDHSTIASKEKHASGQDP